MAGLKSHLAAARAALAQTEAALNPLLVERAVKAVAAALRADRPLLVCGNGGSAADAMHIAGELVGRYLKERRALKAIALAADPAVLTAWSNDHSYETAFARQVEAYGEKGGVLWALSTSGNSRNVCLAAEAARKKGMTVLAMTGQGGGQLGKLADILLDVPSGSTPEIQQVHTCLYHYVCAEVESLIAP
jgi:D-sedoheptulose 7-phosphate isomerase